MPKRPASPKPYEGTSSVFRVNPGTVPMLGITIGWGFRSERSGGIALDTATMAGVLERMVNAGRVRSPRPTRMTAGCHGGT